MRKSPEEDPIDSFSDGKIFFLVADGQVVDLGLRIGQISLKGRYRDVRIYLVLEVGLQGIQLGLGLVCGGFSCGCSSSNLGGLSGKSGLLRSEQLGKVACDLIGHCCEALLDVGLLPEDSLDVSYLLVSGATGQLKVLHLPGQALNPAEEAQDPLHLGLGVEGELLGLLRGRPSGLGVGIPHLHLEEEGEVVRVQRIERPRARRGDGGLQAGLERLVLHVGEALKLSESVRELLVLGFLGVDLLDSAFDEQLLHGGVAVVGQFWDHGLQVEDSAL